MNELEAMMDTGMETADLQVIKELFTKKDIALKTELTHEQIADLCVLLHFAERNRSKAMKLFGNNFMMLMVSKLRKGRGEFIRAWTGYHETQRDTRTQNIEQALR